jgi:dolichol-phosphate mannosyltransferase
VPTILRQGPFDVLIVDDNSPDGTGEVAEKFARHLPTRVSVLHRAGKLGLGTAYLAGFHYALAQGYQQVFTMDADFSHDPSRLPALRAALEHADVALGSRYVPGGGTLRWPLRRRLLSRGGSAYARLVLGLPIRDLTGGFKGFRRQVLEALLPQMETMRSRGYAFQIEMTYRCARLGYSIEEVPILFEDRLVGQSKLSRRIVAEALWVVWALRLSQGPARTHGEALPRVRTVRWRLGAVAMALACLVLLLGTVNLATKWLAQQARGGTEQAASLSHLRPAPSARRAGARTRTASLQLEGADLTPNVPLRFTGAGFLPGEGLVVTIQDPAGRPEDRLALLSADHAGQISTTEEAIPVDLPPGIHLLLIGGESSHRVAQASFQVHWIPPTVQLDAYTVKSRHDIGFAGSGFLPNEVVVVRLGTAGQIVTTVNANAGGNIAGRFTVPLIQAGTYSLSFVGQESQTPASVGLNVQGFHPWVLLDTYAPSPHTHLGFTGEDFAPQEIVLVYLNQREGESVVRLQADASGRFAAPAAWEVGKLSGQNTLIFVGQQSGAVVISAFTA